MNRATTATTPAATLHPMTTGTGRRLLVGHATGDIEAGSVLCLVRDGDAYSLRALAPDQMQDVEAMASFWPPEAVDHRERLEILDRIEPPKPKRKRA